jgi:hypothetical protein
MNTLTHLVEKTRDLPSVHPRHVSKKPATKSVILLRNQKDAQKIVGKGVNVSLDFIEISMEDALVK